MVRKELKKLYKDKDIIESEIQKLTYAYMKELGDDRGIYISDHAIVRYLERVKGQEFDDSLTDENKLKDCGYIGHIRDEMLSLDEDREILRNRKSFFFKDGYGYIIKELAVVTVLIV